MNAAVLQSPCIKVCEMEPASGLCTGCGRTLDEIAHWGAMTDRERAAIMTGLAERMHRAGLQPKAAASAVQR